MPRQGTAIIGRKKPSTKIKRNSRTNLPEYDEIKSKIGTKSMTIEEFASYLNYLNEHNENLFSVPFEPSACKKRIRKICEICPNIPDLKFFQKLGKRGEGHTRYLLPPGTHEILAACILLNIGNNRAAKHTSVNDQECDFKLFDALMKEFFSPETRKFIEALPFYLNKSIELKLARELANCHDKLWDDILNLPSGVSSPFLAKMILLEKLHIGKLEYINKILNPADIIRKSIDPQPFGSDDFLQTVSLNDLLLKLFSFNAYRVDYKKQEFNVNYSFDVNCVEILALDVIFGIKVKIKLSKEVNEELDNLEKSIKTAVTRNFISKIKKIWPDSATIEKAYFEEMCDIYKLKLLSEDLPKESIDKIKVIAGIELANDKSDAYDTLLTRQDS
jgi:hypothetical protein